MKHARIAVLLGLVLMLSLVSSVPLVSDGLEQSYEIVAPIPSERFEKSYDTHADIVIANDTDFITQAEDELWPGDGSIDTPYYITGWNITSDSTSIDIYNVSLYFVIHDCYLSNLTDVRSDGIRLYNVTHASIQEVIITGKAYGIYATLSDYLMISGCGIDSGLYSGIFIEASDNCVIDSCEVYGRGHRGVYSNQCQDLVVSNCDFYDNDMEGIYLFYSDYCNVTGTFSFDNGGSGILAYNSHFCSFLENTLCNNSRSFVETGIHLDGSDHTMIVGNEIFSNELAGIFVSDSHYTQILENDIYNNTDFGIEGVFSENCTASGNDIWDNGWYPIPEFTRAGIIVGEAQGWVIEANRIWNNSYSGIELNDVSHCIVNDNQIYNNSDHGVYGYWANYVEVTGNDIYGNGWNPQIPDLCGIYAYVCSNWTIEGNTIWYNSMNGITMDGDGMAGDVLIVDNDIHSNEAYGIVAAQTDEMTILENIVYDQFCGIAMVIDGCEVTGNIVFDNDFGIIIEFGTGNTLLWNDMGWNNLYNAFDNGGEGANTWSDGEDGNWYSDYDGEGPYPISNNTGIGAYDYSPHKSLELYQPFPSEYEITTTGNTMLFPAQALNPSVYEVYENGTLLYTETWDGNDIEAEVDGLPVGVYNITVRAFHISGHSLSATSFLEVVDLTSPEWNPEPANQEVYVGQFFSYQVNATDPSGIAGWAVNGTLFTIDSTGLITNASTLAVGEYTLNITVWDQYGNTGFHVITIQVLPETTSTTTTTTPIDSTVLLVVIGAGGAVVIILGAIVILRKRPG
jgi:parallel beta-helix repeat protein